MSDVVRWVFDDATVGDSYTFAINPNDGGTPVRQKSITYQKTSASDGKTLVFEGLDEPMTSSFSGTILEQDQHDTIVSWFTRRHSIKVTDDLSRQFIIYITKFEAKRVRAASHPWKHTYTVEYVVLGTP